MSVSRTQGSANGPGQPACKKKIIRLREPKADEEYWKDRMASDVLGSLEPTQPPRTSRRRGIPRRARPCSRCSCSCGCSCSSCCFFRHGRSKSCAAAACCFKRQSELDVPRHATADVSPGAIRASSDLRSLRVRVGELRADSLATDLVLVAASGLPVNRIRITTGIIEWVHEINVFFFGGGRTLRTSFLSESYNFNPQRAQTRCDVNTQRACVLNFPAAFLLPLRFSPSIRP